MAGRRKSLCFQQLDEVLHYVGSSASVKTTMIYTHVLNRGGQGVASPADDL